MSGFALDPLFLDPSLQNENESNPAALSPLFSDETLQSYHDDAQDHDCGYQTSSTQAVSHPPGTQAIAFPAVGQSTAQSTARATVHLSQQEMDNLMLSSDSEPDDNQLTSQPTTLSFCRWVYKQYKASILRVYPEISQDIGDAISRLSIAIEANEKIKDFCDGWSPIHPDAAALHYWRRKLRGAIRRGEALREKKRVYVERTSGPTT
ncbi:MAG: hypothetical protein Q9218_003424 [Villophora microphyllina]